ncbi:MAG: hypothetical protein U9R58_09720, partial [Chloroflexota bacterium]|nr:hypothetical protein [Chloroflexota bacterium]
MFSKRSFQLIHLVLFLILAVCTREESTTQQTQVPSQGATPSLTLMYLPTDTPVPPELTSEITTQLPLTSTPIPVVIYALLPANVQVMPEPEAYAWELVAEGFSRPVALVSSMDGSDRLFVAEQQGVVRIIQDGEALPVPFLDLRDRVSTSGGV